MKRYLLSLLSCITIGCINSGKHQFTSQWEKHLYIERYSAGLIGNLTAEYLTDSTNFRIYVGTFDEETSWFYYKRMGDIVSIEKIEHAHETFKIDTTIVNGKIVTVPKLTYKLKTVSKKIYSLEALKEQHHFD